MGAMRWFVLVCGPLLVAAVPRFDSAALMKGVLVPADAAVGSVIYRLRASDSAYDYPLLFAVDEKLTIVSVETLNCTRFNSVCQANVVLRKRLEIGTNSGDQSFLNAEKTFLQTGLMIIITDLSFLVVSFLEYIF